VRTPPINPPTISDLGGETRKIRRLISKQSNSWSAFNPSIAYSDKDGYLCLIRSSNYYYDDLGQIKLTTENKVRNKTYIARLDSEFSIIRITEVNFIDGPTQQRGVEDARLFQRNGYWLFHAVMREEHTPEPRICVYQLDIHSGTAVFVEKYESEGYQPIEKNWMTTSKYKNENFEFVYSTENIVKRDGSLARIVTQGGDIKTLRGGSSLLELGDGNYLAVAHYCYHVRIKGFAPERFGYVDSSLRKYTHVFALFNDRGQLTHISQEFVFDKLQIEFACGIENYKDKFVISYGAEDLSSHLAFIGQYEVSKILRPI
jgi:predicted GH43/DUF377 family glycosyl hydrolase